MFRSIHYYAALLCISLNVAFSAFAAPPTQSSRDISYTNQDGHQFTLNLIRGNGARRIVIARSNQPVTSLPVNGRDYNHNQQFGKGDELNEGEFVVFDGEQAGFSLTGLSPATTYYFAVFEYNGIGFSTEYLTTSFATASFATVSPPDMQVSGLMVKELNGNSAKINWVNGNGSRRLIIIREGAPVQVNPQDLVNYNGRSDFGNGSQVAPGTFAVAFFNQQGITSVSVTELQPNTTYYVKAFESNGSNGPVFQPAGAPEVSFTTSSHPTIAAKDLAAGTPEGNVVSISWKNGNGTRRMVVVREGQPHTAVPQNGQDYIGTDIYTGAPEMAPGHRILYHTNGNQWLNMRGAKPNTTYYFKVYESSGTGSRTTYRVTDAGAGAFATSSAPDIAPSQVVFSQATPGTVTVAYTPGNGTGRLVIARANEPVNVVPEDIVAINGNSNFGSGQNLGNGNIAITFGPNTKIQVTGLTPGVTYHYAVFEYNGNHGKVYNKQPARGSFTQSNRPTIAVSQPAFSLVDVNKFRLAWTQGNGQRRLVLLRKGAPVSMVPEDGLEYTAQSNAAMATDLGNGHKAIYYNSGTVVDITGLEPATTYHIQIFEAAGTGAQVQYLTSDAPAGMVSTVGTPTEGPKAFLVKKINPTNAHLNINPGNGNGTFWVMREGAPVDAAPQDLTVYYSGIEFGSDNTGLGGGNFNVHQSVNTETIITGLKPGTTYHLAAFAYNGSNLKVYNRNQVLRFSFTTPFRPDVAPANPAFSLWDGGAMRLSWAPGNGTGRIVVARAGSPVNAVPADGTEYAGNRRFDQATEINQGQRVVYNGSGNTVDLTGLTHSTVYHFAVIEYTKSQNRIEYLTTSVLQVQQATLPAPTVQVSNGRSTNVGATTATLGWTNGNGSNRLVVVRKGEPVAFEPAHYIRYNHSASFSSAGPQADGSRVVAITSGTQTEITNLQSGTTYHVAIFEFNGSNSPAYLMDQPARFTFTTIGAPAEPASNVEASQKQNTSLRLTWTNGSGQRRLVMMRAGLPVNGAPVENQRYMANSFFGSGAMLPNGNSGDPNPNYVVYNGEGKEVIVTNLQADTRYHVAIIEFNDFGNSVMYQQVPYLTGEVTSSNPLPLRLGKFSAQQVQSNVVLDWSTLQEQHTSFFAVEVKQDGGEFAQVATVAAAGNSQQLKSYQYLHYRPGTGMLQYRLRMADKDGTYTYSPVVTVFIKGSANTTWSVQGAWLHLQPGYHPMPGTRVSIYSLNGKKILEQKLENSSVQIYIGHYPKGFYMLCVQDTQSQKTYKIMW